MKNLLMVAIMAATTIASADIGPKPKRPDRIKTEITTSVIEGDAAAALYESMNVEEDLVGALRTARITEKVLRAKDGMDQVICTKTESKLGKKRVSVQCDTQTSETDEKLPEHVTRRIMG